MARFESSGMASGHRTGAWARDAFSEAGDKDALLLALEEVLPKLDTTLTGSDICQLAMRLTAVEPATASTVWLSAVLNAECSVRALGPAVAAIDVPTSPQLARSVQASENLWRRLESEFRFLSSSQVAQFLGASATNRNFASEKRSAGKLLAVQRGGSYRHPAFQLDEQVGQVIPVVEPLIRLARENGWSDADLIIWLCSPSAYFAAEDRPVDHLAEPDAVLAAARDEFEAAW